MEKLEQLFVELSENSFVELAGKVPTHKLEKPKTFDDVKSSEDFAIMIKGNYVVLDFDNKTDYLKMKELATGEGLQCHIMETSRGGHFWFKNPNPVPNHVHMSNGLTLEMDIRSFGKKSYVKVKSGNEYRKWVQVVDEVENLPHYLQPIKHEFRFGGKVEGSRNAELFSYIITLTTNGYTKEETKETIRLINKYIFNEPLPERELETILRDESFENLTPSFFNKKQFLHNVFGDYIANTHNIKRDSNRLLIYDEGYYSDDLIAVERSMIKHIPNIQRHQRREVLEYLKIMSDDLEKSKFYQVCAENGVYDLMNDDIYPHDPKYNMRNKLNVKYAQDAYDETVDKTLDKISCHDPQVRQLLEEMIGYSMLSTAKYQVSFILYGDGSNGKSTLLDMIINMIGDNNVSSLSLAELNHNFKLSEITGKLVNIGDDINDDYMKDNSIFKKLVTGDEVTVDKKNEQPYKIRNYATLMFATNNLPKFKDKSEGNDRRLIIVPFDARFSKDDPDYDPFIAEKLETENAKSYLFNLAIQGAKRLIVNNMFTKCDKVDKMMLEFKEENNNVVAFLKTKDPEGLTTQELYAEYGWYCESNGYKPFTLRKFNTEVRKNSNYDTRLTTKKGKGVQKWEVKR